MRWLHAAIDRFLRRPPLQRRSRRRRMYEPDLALMRLEPRRLLNADFGLAAEALQLDFAGFGAADGLTIGRSMDQYQFTLDSGVWSGVAAPGVSGGGTGTLSVDAAVAGGLAAGVRVRDDGDLQVNLQAADFGGLAGGLHLLGVEGVGGAAGPFVVPNLSITSTADLPFSLRPINLDGNLTITAASSVDDFAGSGQLTVTGDLTITAGALPGDFNGDKTVDAADYLIWRSDFGLSGPLADGDANGDGVTDAADYTLWRDNLGRSVDAGTSTIDLGIGLDVEVGGLATLESRGGGGVNLGGFGGGDSGRDVELGTLGVSTTGDVFVVEDSAEGLFLTAIKADEARLETTAPGADIAIDASGSGIGVLSLHTRQTAPGALDANATLELGVGFSTLRLGDSRVEGGFSLAAGYQGLVDVGQTVVLGDAAFELQEAGADIQLDQLAVAGAIGLKTAAGAAPGAGDATIVNATAINFSETEVVGSLTATALSGDITNAAGPLDVRDAASFTASAGGIQLGQTHSATFGSLSLAGGVVQVSEADATLLVSVNAASLNLASAGEITDQNLASINVAGDATFAGTGVALNQTLGDVLQVGGVAAFLAPGGSIVIGPGGTANFGALSATANTAIVQEDSTTVLQDINVVSFELDSEGITDNSNIVIPGDATFVSAGDILLADNPGDVLTITGAASFTAGGRIELGLGGAANFGSLALATTAGGDATVREGSGTLLGAVAVDDFVLTSAGGVTNQAGGSIVATGDAAVMATGAIDLASAAAGSISVAGQAAFTTADDVTVGANGAANFGSLLITADEARVDEQSSMRIDGATARVLRLNATGSLTDATGATILVADNAELVASGSIFLADSPVDQINVGAEASIIAGGALTIGPAGVANFGRLALTGTTVRVQEDSSTEIFDITANTLQLSSAGAITDLLGLTVAVSGDASFTAAGPITLADTAADSYGVGGLASFITPAALAIGPAGLANFGSLAINASDALVQEDSSTLLVAVSASSLVLTSAGSITDAAGATIVVAGAASFEAAGPIVLADNAADSLGVGGLASFVTPGALAIGPAGAANFGSLAINAGAATVQEDSSTLLSSVSATSLSLNSAGSIADIAGATISVAGAASFVAAGPIVLADNAADSLGVGGLASFVTPGALAIGPAGAANFGSLAINAGAAMVQEDSATRLASVSASSLMLESAGSITDVAGAAINVLGAASFVAAGPITLADSAPDSLVVGANALFNSVVGAAIDVGVTAAGDPSDATVGFGTLSFRSQDGAAISGRVRIAEDNAMVVVAGDFDKNALSPPTANLASEVVLVADNGDGPVNATAASILLAGPIAASAVRLQSDGSITQPTAGAINAEVLQAIAGYDVAAYLADPSQAPARAATVTPDIVLTSPGNTFGRLAVAAANGSVDARTISDLTIAATVVDGRSLSGIQIVDGRGGADAANAALDLTLALTSTGGGINQQRVNVLAAPAPERVAIDADVARASFAVAAGESISLLDMQIDESAPGDALLLNQDAVRGSTANRFYLDNPLVPAARRETQLVFEATAGAPVDIAIADQTAIQLGFAAPDKTFAFAADGDVIVIAGKSPDGANAITGAADIGGRLQLHANSALAAAQGGDISVTLQDAGPLAITTDGGDAQVTSLVSAVFRSDIDTLVRELAPGDGGDLSLTSGPEITDEAGASIVVEGDADLQADFTIMLADAAADVLTVGGLASLTARAIEIGPAGEANFGSLSLDALLADVQEDSTTVLNTVDVDVLRLASAGDVLDTSGPSSIVSSDSAEITAAGDITLATNLGDSFSIANQATFTAGDDITIGPAGVVNFGVLSLFGDAASVQEDSATEFNAVGVRTLGVQSAGGITDVTGASIVVTADANFVASGPGDITLADAAADVLTVGGHASFVAVGNLINLGPAGAANFGTLSLVAAVAIVQEDSTTVLDTLALNTLALNTAGQLLDVADANLVVGANASFNAAAGITLNTDAADLLTVAGLANFVAGGDITIGPAGLASFGALALDGQNVFVQEDSATALAGVLADALVLSSAAGVSDLPGTAILVSGAANVTADSAITLADAAGDTLAVGGAASFTTPTDILIGPAGLVSFGSLSLAGDQARVQEDSSTLLDQVTLRELTLSSTGEIGDLPAADITVAELATLTATTPFEDIILGDQSAVLRLGSVNLVAAEHASLQELDGFELAGANLTGTLFATAAGGSIVQQLAAPTLVAEAIGLRTPGGAVLLLDTQSERFAAEAGGAEDLAGRSPELDALLAELADARITPGDDAGLAPTTLLGDALATLDVGSQFGVLVFEHLGDLTIGRVNDPTSGAAGDADGVRSTAGAAYVATLGFAAEPGDLVFDGAGTPGGQAVRVENDHVFTAVAAGELVINTATTSLVATGSLGLGVGVVNDVGAYLSYDDRDGFRNGEVVLAAVAKEGVGLVVTIPSTALNAPTSRLVGAGNLDPETGAPAPNTQFVDLVVGRTGETNLGVRIVWADGAVTSGFQAATDPADGPTPGDVFSHTFSPDFLSDGVTNPNFPLLPTSIVAFNDPRINLFSQGGEQNLNRSVTPPGAATPERIDQFVLASTQQIFLVGEEPAPPEASVLFTPPPPVQALTTSNDFLLETQDDFRTSQSNEEDVAIEFGPLDEATVETPEPQVIEGLTESWNKGAGNYVAEIKEEVLGSDRPAGRYLIRAERTGAAAPDFTIFEKESSVADPSQGAAVPVGEDSLVEQDLNLDPEGEADDEWTAAWREWARSEAEEEASPLDAVMVGDVALARRAAK